MAKTAGQVLEDEQNEQMRERLDPKIYPPIPKGKPEEKGFEVPPNIVRWISYAVFFSVLLTPFYIRWPLLTLSATLLLAHFSSQINALRK